MTLRLKINLIVGALTLLFMLAALWLQLLGLRESVHEEVMAANRVAVQMLDRTLERNAPQGLPAVLTFLTDVGRVRANDITLFDREGQALYHSPPSRYKPGRNAPQWFDAVVAPAPSVQAFELPGGKLVVESNASRSVLDAWEYLTALASSGLLFLVSVNALLFWLVGRAVRPFRRIVVALNELQAGHFEIRLPALAGFEAATIGVAFNRMVGELQRHIETERDTERRAVRAEMQLSDSRALTRGIDQHIERERLLIARELHDELGQSVTAIRSMALSIAQRMRTLDPQAEAAARLIADESSRLYDAMHGMIPRLTPLVLDNFGLAEALRDLVERTRRSQPEVQIDLHVELGPLALGSDAALALYRAAQEGISNALRHGQAQCLQLSVVSSVVSEISDAASVTLDLTDNGHGLAPDWSTRTGHFGLRWLTERIEALGGEFSIQPALPRGVQLRVQLRVQEQVWAQEQQRAAEKENE